MASAVAVEELMNSWKHTFKATDRTLEEIIHAAKDGVVMEERRDKDKISSLGIRGSSPTEFANFYPVTLLPPHHTKGFLISTSPAKAENPSVRDNVSICGELCGQSPPARWLVQRGINMG